MEPFDVTSLHGKYANKSFLLSHVSVLTISLCVSSSELDKLYSSAKTSAEQVNIEAN